MARTRGAKSSSPSSRLRVLRDTPIQGSTFEPPRPPVVPPPKKAKVSNPSSELESKPRPSPPPAKKPQPSQTPAKESQIPSGMTPEVVIRRPMVTQPPIEGNLDCRARPFHSELCFDTATFKLQPELKDSFHLLQRYHMEYLLTPTDFFYQSMTTNQVRDPTVIHFTIDGRHGILGARHIAEALRIPYEPAHPKDFRVWTHPA
ncbi:hypothetical protein AAG906_001717 [Vitis piasezkii]